MRVTGLSLCNGAVETAPPVPPIEVQSLRVATQLAGKLRRTLRSTLHCRFHVQGFRDPGPRGLPPQRADFQIVLQLALSFDHHTNRLPHIPKFRTSSKSPVCGERSVRARKLGRIRILCVLCFQRFDAEKCWIDTPSILPIFQTRSIVSGPRVSRRTFPLFTTGLYLRHSGSRSARPESGAAAATFALDSGFIANAMPGIP
jgi:hypothetical protein